MADMQTRYDLAGVESHQLLGRDANRSVIYDNCVKVYQFVPKSPGVEVRLSSVAGDQPARR
jgi:hypothetical protein